jgi:two-component system, NtrC family, sensor kinase
MSIRKKTLIIVGLTLIVLMAVMVIAAKVVVTEGFVALETEEAQMNVKRAVNKIDDVLETLKSVVGDWAPWDETYQFAEDLNKNYIETNLNNDTLGNLNIKFMIFLSNDGQLLYEKALDSAHATEIALSRPLIDKIREKKLLREFPDVKSSRSGLIITSDGPLLVASRAILKSDFSGPTRGALVVGKFLDEPLIKEISQNTHTQLSVQLYASDQISSDFKTAKASFSENTPIPVFPLDADTIGGYAIIKNIDGDPAVVLKAEMPRKIFRQGQTTINYYLISIAGIGILFVALIMVFLEKSVLSPLSNLNLSVSRIGESGNFSMMLPSSAKDEIGNLANEINKMLNQLSESRIRLMEQSYWSGMAEMASGVLHNVRNSLNPIVGQIQILRDDIGKFPINQIETAKRELEEGNISEERRLDLKKFLYLADQRLLDLVSKTKSSLGETTERISHVEQILDDHQKWSNYDSPSESIMLHDLVGKSVDFLRSDWKDDISIDVEPAVAASGSVVGNKIRIEQVFGNILNNAIESIRRKGNGSGKIRILAGVEKTNGQIMKHVQISDDGAGIESDKLEQVFKRGFTTKSTGSSGIGLHWCANAVSAMNGKMYAESQGPGKGACFHLLLPGGAI